MRKDAILVAQAGKIEWPWSNERPLPKVTRPDGSPWPRISIVTPSFNQGLFIEQTIRAILLQGYPNLEYIIIDGRSNDGSVDIIQRFRDHLAYWESTADHGQSDAINKGFARATGDIITFCNSDDYYLPGTLADVAKTFQQNPNCGAIVGGFRYIDEEGRFISDTRMPVLLVETPYDLTLGPPGIYRLHQAATFFTRQALDETGRYVRSDLEYVLDRELLYRVAQRFPIVTRQKTYSAFRLHKHSKSVSRIMPFAEEFGMLYEKSLSGNRDEDRQRLQMAQHHRARGYLKYAQTTNSSWESVLALSRALTIMPSYALKKGYYAHWLRVFGFRK